MIFSYDFIALTSEFAQHGVAIALAGLVILEFFRYPKTGVNRGDLLRVTAIVAFVIAWLFSEFFFASEKWYILRLMFYLPHVVAVPIGLFPIARRSGRNIISLLVIFSVLIVFNLLADVFVLSYYLPWMYAVREMLKATEVTILYFMVLQIFVGGTASLPEEQVKKV